MKANIIIIVGENQSEKADLIEKIKMHSKISYTKLEVLFQAITEFYGEEDTQKRKEMLQSFLKQFLKNLSNKDEVYVIDVDYLLEKNAMSLVNEYENVIISYLNEITIQSERIKKLDSQNVKEFIEENIKEEGKHE